MGQLFSDLFKQPNHAKIPFLGLDGSGKTTILYRIKEKKIPNTFQTLGFNIEVIYHNNNKFTVFDVDGRVGTRPMWKNYYEGTNAVVFVIDSNDRERMEEASELLHKVVNDPLSSNAKLLIWLNKQDLTGSASESEISNILKLNSIQQEYKIQACSALNGTGLLEGLEWLSNKLF